MSIERVTHEYRCRACSAVRSEVLDSREQSYAKLYPDSRTGPAVFADKELLPCAICEFATVHDLILVRPYNPEVDNLFIGPSAAGQQ